MYGGKGRYERIEKCMGGKWSFEKIKKCMGGGEVFFWCVFWIMKFTSLYSDLILMVSQNRECLYIHTLLEFKIPDSYHTIS